MPLEADSTPFPPEESPRGGWLARRSVRARSQPTCVPCSERDRGRRPDILHSSQEEGFMTPTGVPE